MMGGLTEIHCHILPKVDDGAQTLKETVQMLRMEAAAGVTRIVLTPHYRRGMFETPEKEIVHRFLKLREMVEQAGIEIKLYLGREYYADSDLIDNLRKCRFLTLNRTNYVLIEFPYEEEFRKLRNCVYEVVSEGYIPIIAHVERYSCIRHDMELLEELIDLGAYIQVNAGAVLGNSGMKQKRFCKKLMKNDYIHFIASDAHNTKTRVPNLGECEKYVEKKMGQEYARKIFYRNPRILFKRR